MNVTSPISIPFYKGLSLIVEPGHEEHLRIALANISAVTDAINRESPRVSWRPFR